MKDNLVVAKSKAFAVKIIRMYQYLCEVKKDFVMSKQLLRSGTSIGANVKEAVNAQSKREFIAKLNISLKEANEVEYWLELLFETGYIGANEFNSMVTDCKEILKLYNIFVRC